MTTLLYLMACLMSPSPLINLAESRATASMPFWKYLDHINPPGLDTVEPFPILLPPR